MAVQRIRDGEATWKRFEMDTGFKRRFGLHLTDADIAEIKRQLMYELAGGLDGERLEAASDRLARLLMGRVRKSGQEVRPGKPTGKRDRATPAT